MIPTLFSATYKPNFSTVAGVYPIHGDVDLVDALECYATQLSDDDSVEWELEMVYPMTGQWFKQLDIEKIIVVKANSHQQNQAFRIYSIQRNINKTVTVKAQHISYDMANIPTKPFIAEETSNQTAAQRALALLRSPTYSMIKTVYGIDNYFYTSGPTMTSNTKFKNKEPKSMRAVLFDGDDSIKGTYGGDPVIDNHHVEFKPVAGRPWSETGLTLEYGVDLIDLEQEKNISETITGILPYYRKSQDNSNETANCVYGDIVYGSGTHAVQKIIPVDLTAYVNAKDSDSDSTIKDKLAKEATKWVNKNKVGRPDISLKVSYAYLNQDVRIFDEIRVKFDKLGVDNAAKVVKYKYNVLKERCEEIEVGRARGSKYFNLLDASKLRKGYVPPERVKQGSLRGSSGRHIAGGTVTKEEIKPLTIDQSLLGDEAVIGRVIKPGEITGGKNGHIAQYTIEPDCIAGGALNSTSISRIMVNGTIDTDQLNSLSVTHAKIATGAVSLNRLTDGFKGWVTEQGWTREEQ